MANFRAHVTIGGAASFLAAAALIWKAGVHPVSALIYGCVGTVGSILPDIDLHYSTPSKNLFHVFGVLVGAAAAFSAAQNNMLLYEVACIAVGWFLIVRFGAREFFFQACDHRGAMHSILVALISAELTIILATHGFMFSRQSAYIMAAFMFFGFVIHLLLDEIYSVDFSNRRFKRSFGTALKLVSDNKVVNSLLALLFSALFLFIFVDYDQLFVE